MLLLLPALEALVDEVAGTGGLQLLSFVMLLLVCTEETSDGREDDEDEEDEEEDDCADPFSPGKT